MSGPPYPHPPGSNAIGDFVIGVSPIGTLSTYDVWATVISQYGNSPVLTAIIEAFNDAADQTGDFDAFFDKTWNVATAEGYGLDVWGRIVGVSRTLQLVGADTYFGFEEAGDGEGFGQAPFFSGQPLTSNFDLSDDAYRLLIYAKAQANISDGGIPAINQIMLNLFPGRGDCYVIDNQDMSMVYQFNFALTPSELAIMQSANVLPTPAGVSATIAQNP